MPHVGLPPELTAEDWNKKKGVFAKIFGKKTGVGEALTKFKVLYTSVDQGKVSAGGYGKLGTVEEVNEKKKMAADYYNKEVGKIRAEVIKLVTLLTQVKEKFKADKKIPASSATHVEKMIVAANGMRDGFKNLVNDINTFDAKIAQINKQIEDQKTLIRPNITKLELSLQKLVNDPDWQVWNGDKGKCYDNFRSVCNGIKVNPEWNKLFWAVWQKLDGMQPGRVGIKTPAKKTDKLSTTDQAALKKIAQEGLEALVPLKKYFGM